MLFLLESSPKTKIRKDLWYFVNSLLWKPEFSSEMNLFFLKKAQRNDHSSASNWSEYSKICFKKNVRTFSISHQNVKISRLKKRL